MGYGREFVVLDFDYAYPHARATPISVTRAKARGRCQGEPTRDMAAAFTPSAGTTRRRIRRSAGRVGNGRAARAMAQTEAPMAVSAPPRARSSSRTRVWAR